MSSPVWRDPNGSIRIRGYHELLGAILRYLYLDGKARTPAEETEYQKMRKILEDLFPT